MFWRELDFWMDLVVGHGVVLGQLSQVLFVNKFHIKGMHEASDDCLGHHLSKCLAETDPLAPVEWNERIVVPLST